ncbi:hypothetical protein BBO99_00006121 [Phytophthora kernoviae]|uniref:Uncharacterized protein n=2 Tax=Phytophthora kernoviae TaxID=325452 RepID=A0A3R7KSX4_9STRA|nr:hypothetical protein G195_007353 [Phytophthora kernoviae 00238/432]KAG2526987.1 hypothetical protein JM16_002377 [Phytophthora kernoviae]KAG2528508.1 hypothetical protein JM18_003059 [Phytophthora kernoviae]RLN14172.1 hypothetical protein BBI17_006260 [Phytophthora kernoviae]RLN78209.1 hypothetical protein BBO99_00006121 [Phytophthora kernoviae]
MDESGPASAHGLLTQHGVRGLFWNSNASNDIRLQVLGIYRYVVDPALKQRLGQAFEGKHYAFDMKAVLSPSLNELVWKREIVVQRIISVTKFEVFNEDPEDEQRKQRVCVLQEAVVTTSDDVGLPEKLFDRRFGVHNDHYALDWACSFTDGVAEKDSPLDELEINWASRYTGTVAAGEAATCNERVPRKSLAVTWDSTPIYCSSLFTNEFKKVHKILEAMEVIKVGSSPPLVGAIRVKSKVIHVGDPNVSNPFPFVFNIVVVDVAGASEVAFYGSMCAKYFLSLREGDLVQLRGYSVVFPPEIDFASSISPVLYYEHESSGSVFHVPRKYWKVLGMTNVTPPLLHVEARTNATQQNGDPANAYEAGSTNYHRRPSWLVCSFVTTLNTLYWGKSAISEIATMYFDFVGVLSSVGKICRTRKRKLGEGNQDAEATEFRWVKVIDNSSSYELVIKLQEFSQPVVFRTLEAGDTFMVTKLQWVILPNAAVDRRNQIHYATSSVYSVLRVNETIRPFHSLDECNLNDYFASNVKKNAVVEMNADTGENRLAAYIEKKYHPRNRLPTEVDLFKEVFSLEVLSFSDLACLLSEMEDLEHQHVGVIGHVCKVRSVVNTNNTRLVLDLSDENETNMLTVHAVGNPLYQKAVIKGNVKTITPHESLPLIRLLPPDVIDDMYTKAAEESPLGTKLSLAFIEKYLSSANKEYFFSVHLFRDAVRGVKWEVDAILQHEP